jgi:hypothetical protein
MKTQRRWAFSSAFLLCSSLIGGSAPAMAQELALPEVIYPVPPKQAASADGFVPQGWSIEARASGDLNRDGIADLALVLRQRDPKNIVEHAGLGEKPFNTNPRILAVAFRDGPAGDYILQVANHTLIPRREDPVQADPFGDENGGISIERGVLSVTLQLFMTAGGWDMFTATHKFQYRNGRLELIGYDRSNVNRASGKTNDISVNYLTGKMKLAAGDVARDNPVKVSWKTLSRRSPLVIDELGDGLSFDPQP